MLTIDNAADWHATMAMKAYRKKDYLTYTRHIRICDNLRWAVHTMALSGRH